MSPTLAVDWSKTAVITGSEALSRAAYCWKATGNNASVVTIWLSFTSSIFEVVVECPIESDVVVKFSL